MIHLAYLPVPAGVLEWDVVDPPSAIPVLEAGAALRVLVRERGRPVDWITVEKTNRPFSTSAVSSAIASQLGWAFEVASVAQAIGGDRPLAPAVRDYPDISVVVCTRDRAESLQRCLESLGRLEYPSFEVIVVDNASATAATASVAAQFPVRYVREERPGLDWARNRGISEARHAIVAFTDDDVVVDRRWLTALADGFAEPEVMLVTGLVAPAELETEAQVIFEYQYGGMSKGLRPIRRDPARMSKDVLIGTHHLGVGANMAFRREVLERLGGFDTALDVGTPSHGGGDLDMFHRVLADSGVARYQPTALVWHFHRRDLAALHRQLRDNGRAFGVYLFSQAFPTGPRRRRVGAAGVLGYGLGVWLRWMIGRVFWRFLRKETLSLPLQASEMRGVLEAPWAFLATRRSDRRLRRKFASAAGEPSGS